MRGKRVLSGTHGEHARHCSKAAGMRLQLKGVGTDGFDARKAKQKEPRLVEVVLLKNRNGRTGDGPTLAYYPRFGFFEDTDE